MSFTFVKLELKNELNYLISMLKWLLISPPQSFLLGQRCGTGIPNGWPLEFTTIEVELRIDGRLKRLNSEMTDALN